MLLFVALLVAVRWVHEEFCPPTIQAANKAVVKLLGFCWKHAVVHPMQKHGWLITLWFWLIGLAMTLSCAGVAMLPTTYPGIGVASLVCSIGVWWLVVRLWHYIRRKAIRRYTPRPLPTRYDGR